MRTVGQTFLSVTDLPAATFVSPKQIRSNGGTDRNAPAEDQADPNVYPTQELPKPGDTRLPHPGGAQRGSTHAPPLLFSAMHDLAPLPIIIGVIGVVAGLLWLIAAGSANDGGPEPGLFFVFGIWYIALRVLKSLFSDPMSVLPALGILLGSAALIGLGVVMY